MELHQVRYFLAVADTLNFTRAAEQCNVTQPALTKGLQKLEQELGGELIHRERRLTQLSELGKALLPVLMNVVASAETACRMAREFQRQEIAQLTIGLAPSISAKPLLEPFAAMLRTVKGLRIHLVEEPASRLIDLMLQGEIAAAIVGDIEDVPARVDEWLLYEERYVVMLARNHPLANQEAVDLSDLQQVPLLARADCKLAEKVRTLSGIPAESRWGHSSMQDLHLQQMAAAGFGVLLVPERCSYIAELKTIPIRHDPLKRNVRLLIMQGRRYFPALDIFLQNMRSLRGRSTAA